MISFLYYSFTAMKKTILTILFIVGILNAMAQGDTISYWKKSGKAGLNVSQSQLTNWAAGGQSAVNALGLFSYNLNYKKDKTMWDNSLDLALGYSRLGAESLIKTDDRIEFNSLYGKKAIENLYYGAAFSFKSQFVNGYDYKVDSSTPISGFLAPAYITLGLGMNYKPNKYISFNYSPFTGRLTIVKMKSLSDAGSFGVEPGNTTRFELGSKAWIKIEKEILQNVVFSSKFEAFSDYLKNPECIDIDWQTGIAMKVNKWLSTNLTTHLIYDDDVMITDSKGKKGPRTQFKEVLSVGISVLF